MPLKTIVKVGNITNLSDARYCAGMGVNMLGFPIDDGLQLHISPQTYKEISGWVSGVKLVGEIKDKIPEDYKVDFIQFSNFSMIKTVQGNNIPYIFSIDLEKQDFSDIREISKYAKPEYYLLEIPEGYEMSEIKELASFLNAPILLGYCKSTDDADKYINAESNGIALLGSYENKPGFKDYDQIADVLEYLDAE